MDMGVDEDIATTVFSVFAGLAIGTTADFMMTAAHASGASAAETVFETELQTAILVVMLRVLVNFDDLKTSGGIPFGMALAAAQPGLNKRLSVLAGEVAKVRHEFSRQMVGLAPVVSTPTQESRPS